ncbi:MAG: hypothetical protein AAGC44_07365 [Planctomycetota bacterium]
MSMQGIDDYRDMLLALRSAEAEFLIIGTYALGVHGLVRATKDIDIWVRPSPENAERVWQALLDFGAPFHGVTQEDFSKPGIILQIGVAPIRIDITTKIDGVDFESSWKNRIKSELFGVEVHVIGRSDFITNKRATGRAQDNVDIDRLESLED